MTQDELKLVLEALEYPGPSWLEARQPAITAIKEALALPQRTWVGLTNDELTDLFYNTNLGQQSAVAQAIALLKERNT